MSQACNSQCVQRGRQTGEQSAERVSRAAERVRHACEAAVRSHHGPGREAPEAQGVQVEHGLGFRVGRQENLKAPVEQEAVDAVGSDAAPDFVVCLEQDNPQASILQVDRAAQARDAGAHDHYRLALRAHARAFPRSVARPPSIPRT